MSKLMELVDNYTDTFMGYGNPEARAALEAEVNRVEADAARYRWLRSTTSGFTNSAGERIDVKLNPHEWDAAIDAAIGETK